MLMSLRSHAFVSFLKEYEKEPDPPLYKTHGSQHSTHLFVAVGALSVSILGLLPGTASTQIVSHCLQCKGIAEFCVRS